MLAHSSSNSMTETHKKRKEITGMRKAAMNDNGKNTQVNAHTLQRHAQAELALKEQKWLEMKSNLA